MKEILRRIFIHGNINKDLKQEIPEECKVNSTVIYGNSLKALVGVKFA